MSPLDPIATLSSQPARRRGLDPVRKITFLHRSPPARSLARPGLPLFLVLLNIAAVATDPAPPFRIAGYLPDYRAAALELDAARGLTDLFIFSSEPTATGQLDLSRLDRFPWDTLQDLRSNHGLRLLLCVGGWGRSTHFAAVAGSDVLRQVFVQDAVRICLEKGLDGLDLDWEHPANEREEQSYADLVLDLRRGFDPHGLRLSLTLAAWQHIPARAFEAVDWIQIMSYDHPGPHATFDSAEADLRKLLAAGAPAHKLTLGLPFYGRDRTQRNRTMSYRDILARFQPGPHLNEVDNLYFNGPDLIRRKTVFALEQRLAGVMFWELGQDAPGDASLLRVIRTTVHPPPP